ncbi:alpha/beta hydrolase [Diaphorobacter caeni]|uniref:alpha/beta hydrolase n=1 Tax=Diaphorobacter caeni TaxID=2784387 RepID=UPI00188E5695|nr:alpha/beta hydrolase [Diaphorobacter caeni]MBF5003893.1 alpha/beta hydrolase [Diaphorobacter caeni]
MDTPITFPSDGLKLSAILNVPSELSASEKRPAIVVLHGFGSNKEDGMVQLACRLFERLGYVTLRFDMRGCGQSEGERARVICLEQVSDTRNAVSFLSEHPQVNADAIAVMGHSFGAAVAVYAAGVDQRIAACISSGGWGDGEAKFRTQHASPEAWDRFQSMRAHGKSQQAIGESVRVSRFDIVPIPVAMRSNLPAGSFMDFPFDVVESMYAFRPIDVVGQIAPRPLMLLHPAVDSVTPTQQSIDMFTRAGMPTDLHLVAGIDHFIFSDDSTLVLQLVTDWLRKFFPIDGPTDGART